MALTPPVESVSTAWADERLEPMVLWEISVDLGQDGLLHAELELRDLANVREVVVADGEVVEQVADCQKPETAELGQVGLRDAPDARDVVPKFELRRRGGSAWSRSAAFGPGLRGGGGELWEDVGGPFTTLLRRQRRVSRWVADDRRQPGPPLVQKTVHTAHDRLVRETLFAFEVEDAPQSGDSLGVGVLHIYQPEYRTRREVAKLGGSSCMGTGSSTDSI